MSAGRDKERGGDTSVPPRRSSPATVPTLLCYLAVIISGELLSAFGDPQDGLTVHILLLFALLIHSSTISSRDPPLSRLLTSVMLAPLLRILSLSTPFWPFTTLQWLGIISVPLIAGSLAVMHSLGLKRREVGLTLGPLRRFHWQVIVALTGIPLGVVEYFILVPQPWLATFTAGNVAFALLALALATGFAEELIFRGIMLRCASGLFGNVPSLLYVTTVFAALHIGFLSPVDLAFAFTVGLFFGIVAQRTRTISGIIVAHTLVNVMLYLVVPYYL